MTEFNMENVKECSSVWSRHHGNTMSVPVILKSLGQHTYTEYICVRKVQENAHAEVSSVDCRTCCSTSVR